MIKSSGQSGGQSGTEGGAQSREKAGASIIPDDRSVTAELAVAYVKERRYHEALRYFRKASTLSSEARSYYGLALAMQRQQLDDAVRYCQQAVDQEPIRGDFYHNLGQVYLARGEKQRAVRTFNHGLQAEPRHARLIEAVKRLGIRQRPTVQSLSRTNPINKCLGWVRHRVKKAV